MAHEFKKQAKERQTARSTENGARAKVEDVRTADPLPALLPKTGESGASISGLPLMRSKEVGFVPIPAAFLPYPFSFAVLSSLARSGASAEKMHSFPIGLHPV